MLKLLIYGCPGCPIYEIGEKLSDFHGLPYLTIENTPNESDSYFADKIPSIKVDTGDMSSGSAQSQMVRDPGHSSKIEMLDRAKSFVLPQRSISDAEIDCLLSYEQGICVTQIPDYRLLSWATHVCFLNCSDKGAIDWFSKRRKCLSCGNVHHLDDMPPRIFNICDRCGTDLVVLDEDLPQNVKRSYQDWRNLFWKFEMLSKQGNKFTCFAVEKFAKLSDLISKVNMEYRGKIDKKLNWYNRSLLEESGGGLGPDDMEIIVLE